MLAQLPFHEKKACPSTGEIPLDAQGWQTRAENSRSRLLGWGCLLQRRLMGRDIRSASKNHSSSPHTQFLFVPVKSLLCLTVPCTWRDFVLWEPQQVSWTSSVGFPGGSQASEFFLQMKEAVISFSQTKVPRLPWVLHGGTKSTQHCAASG